MRKTVLFIAMSLDGYIARKDGGVEWLGGEDPSGDTDSGYQTFIQTVDTVIMGWKTYHQITTELSPQKWLYSDMMSYIITHREPVSKKDIRLVGDDPCTLVKSLKQETGKDIWICGGEQIIRQLLKEDLIDRFHISVIPVILGDGIRLFNPSDREINLRLVKTQTYNGIVDLVYEHRQDCF